MALLVEEELVTQLKAKDTKAFRHLYESYAPAFLGSIQKVIPCSLTAEDVLQNTMIKIWSNIEKYDAAKGRLFTWMINITRNETKEYFRTKNHRLSKLIDEESIKDYPIASNIEKVIDSLDLQSMIRLLPPKERAILDLIARGFTCKEVASLVNLPEGTVKTKMRTSYRKLRLALQN